MVRDRGRETGTEEFDMRRFRRPLPAPLTIPMDLVEKLVLQNTRLSENAQLEDDGGRKRGHHGSVGNNVFFKRLNSYENLNNSLK